MIFSLKFLKSWELTVFVSKLLDRVSSFDKPFPNINSGLPSIKMSRLLLKRLVSVL